MAGLAVCCVGVAVWLAAPSNDQTAHSAAHAASAAASAEARQSRTASTAPRGRVPSPAATATATPLCSSPEACGFPYAGDTGPGSTALTAHTGNLEIRQDGETVSGWSLTGSLDVYANDVTIVGSRIDSTDWWAVNLRPGFTGLRVLHSLLTGKPGSGPDNGGEDYAVSNMGDGTVEVGWDDVSVFPNALSLGHGYIHDDYVHDLVPFINRSGNYAHVDAIISDGGDTQGLRIEHNTLINSVEIDKGSTSAIGLLPNTGPISDTTITDNWIAGGSYALYGGGPGATHVVVTGNVFSTQLWSECGYYGAAAYWNAGGDGNLWSENRYSSGESVDIRGGQ